jgi:hypothetical protein
VLVGELWRAFALEEDLDGRLGHASVVRDPVAQLGVEHLAHGSRGRLHRPAARSPWTTGCTTTPSSAPQRLVISS